VHIVPPHPAQDPIVVVDHVEQLMITLLMYS